MRKEKFNPLVVTILNVPDERFTQTKAAAQSQRVVQPTAITTNLWCCVVEGE